MIGAFLLGLECIAVVALQWHYPTDALAGVAFGAGVVLLLDGGLRRVVDRGRRVPSGRRTVRSRRLATPGRRPDLGRTSCLVSVAPPGYAGGRRCGAAVPATVPGVER